ncbi:MAG: hypothetical protein V4481_01295 [Patescibacteria group bacterium]
MTTAYPIYFNKRPVKTVFLVDSKMLDKNLFARIFNYNVDHWNGRFNPIVFTDGKEITEAGWKFLKEFDPDVIKCLVTIDEPLLQKIEDWLSPYLVESNDPNQFIGGGIGNEIRIIRPTQDLISRLSMWHAHDKWNFVLFETKDMQSESLKDFLHFNFRTYEEYMLKQNGEKVDEKKVYPITNSCDLNKTLKELGAIHDGRNVFPIQLCSVPNSADDVEHNYENENFTVIVGNSSYDLVHYWNRSLMIPQWMRTEICHIWLPVEVAEDPEIKEGLQQYIQQRAARTGNNNQGSQRLQFISFSLDEERLKKIADSLGATAWTGKKIEVKKPEQIFPNYGKNHDYFYIRSGMDLHQAYGEEETITIPDLELPEGIQGGQWMLDTYIQYRPEKFGYTNVRHWWRLPNRNHLAWHMFPQKAVRIKRDGIPSVVMESRSSFKPDESILTIKIPGDSDTIRLFIHRENRPFYTHDLRTKIIERNKPYYTQRSDKGRYLQGLVGLFGGLHGAYCQFEREYWRKMFEILSATNLKGDIEKKTSIQNKLAKKLNGNPKDQAARDEEIAWLSEYILDRAKEHGKLGKEIKFQRFVDEMILEIKESHKKQNITTELDEARIKSEKDDLKDDVEGLVDNGIIMMGIKPHCPSCGYSNWYHIDDIKQKSECAGCGYVFNISPEQPWLYRLNSLVQDGVNQHGLVPVLLTLGQLEDDARSSFIYSSSLDLFKRRSDDSEHLGDLDIVCIQDGKFIIGEVKTSSSLFNQEDFDLALRLAKEIKPSIVLFASFDGVKRAMITENIERLNKELNPMGINAILYKLKTIHVQYH